MSRNDDYTAGNLLDCLYHQTCHQLIGTDLSRQINTSITQHINFTGKLDKDDGATMAIIDEKQQKTILITYSSHATQVASKNCTPFTKCTIYCASQELWSSNR